ncbi:hypothetical protein [Burkholderia sp. Ac-20379]|uniref:hypothetical protein n=1 Tax=Burkholderia sp. Ac-20379 TaxID=2703900 RepID=UPI00197DF0A3|nr:hypothetical protein [Burkholderia sp. Ac-20379]MBN3723018.1 hypothetical protein [Burkholderia sp. Ac-20379]
MGAGQHAARAMIQAPPAQCDRDSPLRRRGKPTARGCKVPGACGRPDSLRSAKRWRAAARIRQRLLKTAAAAQAGGPASGFARLALLVRVQRLQ